MERAVVDICIKNFPKRDRAKCPYCGAEPQEIEWTPLGLRIWCRNPECKGIGGTKYIMFLAIPEEELDLIKMTKQLLSYWSTYCRNSRHVNNECCS